MPYYQVVAGQIFQSVDTEIGEVLWRPLSFVRKHEIGPKRFLLLGKNQLSVDVISHDDATVKVEWGIVQLILDHRDLGVEREVVIDQPGLVIGDATAGLERHQRICLKMGQELNLHCTSLMIEGRPNEQLCWSRSLESPEEDLFDRLAIATLKQL